MKTKVAKPYSFCVTAVIDGKRAGLLIERKKASEAKPTYGYFWLDEPEGLAPSTIIRDHCGKNCHSLQCSKYHQNEPKKYARFYIQERVFKEILAYTKAAGESGNMEIERPLTQEYTDDKRGYPQILHRFFYAEPPYDLAEFLDSLDVFTNYVLKKPQGKDYFIGMADKFEARKPTGLFPEENFDLLFTVDDALCTKCSQAAQWFREGGPIFSDFWKKKFYRRSEVDILQKRIFAHRFFLLEGLAATAKSVIVRTLMYELYDTNYLNVYYFDISTQRNFDIDRLVRDVSSVCGLFIIENIHFEPLKVLCFCNRFRDDFDRHFLFTCRQHDEELKVLDFNHFIEVEKLALEPFKDADCLVDRYCSDPDTPSVIRENRNKILEGAKGDFWLLALALQGCGDFQGRGRFLDWVAKKVTDRLVALEFCRDQVAYQYPGIFVALSALYKNEVLTEEKYLQKLGFTRAALNGLVLRGEITRQKYPNQNFYYGLHHSSLAAAYWEHGKQYIGEGDLRDHAQYIWKYAISNVSNGLQAIVAAKQCERLLLTKLKNSNEIIRVLKAEDSITALLKWFVNSSNYHLFENGYPANKEMLSVLLWKIESRDDSRIALDCMSIILKTDLNIGQQLWRVLDRKKIADNLVKSKDVFDLGVSVMFLTLVSENAAYELCELFNTYQLSHNLLHAESSRSQIFCIANILRANKKKGTELWRILKQKVSADNFKIDEKTVDGSCIAYLIEADPEIGAEFCRLLGMKTFADEIDKGRTNSPDTC